MKLSNLTVYLHLQVLLNKRKTPSPLESDKGV
jgi:hypothetical protein